MKMTYLFKDFIICIAFQVLFSHGLDLSFIKADVWSTHTHNQLLFVSMFHFLSLSLFVVPFSPS